MRKSFTAMFLALAPVAALTTLAATAPAHAQQAGVSVALFYDQLSAHGKWVDHPRWGWVWYPVAVEADWRPYTKGRWVWTEEHGWMWASDEPFGWATYHYGRWGYDERYGWVWVPGRTWGPAWVAFRYSDQHVGWAPLPPDTLQIGATLQIDDVVLTAGYYQPRWVFVETRHFVAPQLATYVVPRERNVTFIRETRNVTNIRIQNNIVINRPIEPERLRTLVRTEIPRVRIQEVQDARRLAARPGNQATINNIQVFKKDVNITREARPPERARATDRDRPRVRIQTDAVRPEDRRDRAAPGAPPSRDGDRDRTPERTQPDRDRSAPPAQPRRDDRGGERRDETPSRTTPDRRGAVPAQPATPPDRGQEQRRGATPATPAEPPRTSPGAPPSREGATPPRQRQDERRGDRPPQIPPRTQEDRRGAVPATPAQPPARGQRDDKRGATPATPAQPPNAAPGAPPTRERAQPQRGQPSVPNAPGKPSGEDDKGRGR